MTNNIKMLFKPSNIVLIVFGILFTVFVPMFLTGYSYNVINVALIYTLSVYGASVIMGMGGQASFSLVFFLGIGAYYAANLTKGRLGLMLSPELVLLSAPIIAGIIGFVLGLVLFRLRGLFFVFGSLGVVSIAYIFFSNYNPLFGGQNGINRIPTLSIGSFKFDSNLKWFYLLVMTAVIGYIVVERIRHTKLGRSLASVKDNETTALSLGVNVFMTKVYAFAISAMFAGLSGALYAMQSGYISGGLFTTDKAITFIIMLVMGGLNHTIGAIIGSILVMALPEIFRVLKDYLNIAYGLSIILLMAVQPSGIAGLGVKIAYMWARITGGKKKILLTKRNGEGI